MAQRKSLSTVGGRQAETKVDGDVEVWRRMSDARNPAAEFESPAVLMPTVLPSAFVDTGVT